MKRVLAIIGVILLLFMYGMTMFFAVSDNPASAGWFKASVALTILVPVLIYAMMYVANLLNKKDKK